MSSDGNFLSLSSAISSAIDEGVESLREDKITADEFIENTNKGLLGATLKAIHEVSSGNSLSTKEYGNFYISIIQRFIGDDDKAGFVVDTETRYALAENTMAMAYIFAGYLLRVDQIAEAESILMKSVRGKLETHYVSRTVFTLRSRVGLKRKYPGWCIGIAESVFKKNKPLQSLFYHDREQFLDLLCQVDFLQYYLEFKKTNDLYHGYPNFLYYKKDRVKSIIEKLKEKYNNADQMEAIVNGVSNITAGDFFLNNQWH